jgi:hypothetical protein
MRQNMALRTHCPPSSRKRPRDGFAADGTTPRTRPGSVVADAPGRPALPEDHAHRPLRAARARAGT